ncbi:hypothetical protein AcW1_007418 [Taiwanofungus camphoratus]|nr:hypothetical protein AcW2_007521 [Antrodia cinnamomea]KAI0927294.1 hypothetical protein AcV5_007859 [Antrodia cinnamomea]KAI0953103.1 hypothetical protein AcW1_007418 [Antrodia cinnamomea]
MLAAGDSAGSGHLPPDEVLSTVVSEENSLNGLKKTYLSLLPPVQIIEICLALETHVPLQVRNTIWPTDFEAAILALKKTAASQGDAAIPQPGKDALSSSSGANFLSQGVRPPGIGGTQARGNPPMGSLATSSGEGQGASMCAIDPSLHVGPSRNAAQDSALSPSAVPSSTTLTSASASPVPDVTSQSVPLYPSQPQMSQPVSNTQSTNLYPSASHPPAPYPYAPYGYPQMQQPAYPHTPYYPPPSHHPHAYPPPYGYPGYPPPGYSSPPPTQEHPSQHTQHSLLASTPLVRPPASHSPHPHGPSGSAPPPGAGPSAPSPAPPTDDLPSYEEMIVEALMDTADPEGAAPKELFAWMAARYPLQTNFRPSASQALQKAYKRGRLEKRGGGRYRLNPTWEGGATSKRTTRRPQTLAQTIYVMHHPPQPSSSPFTHAPLAPHPHHPQHPQYPPPSGSPPPGSGQPAPYPGYPYWYPPPGYPPYPPTGYPPYPPPATGDTSAQEKAAAAAPSSAQTSTSAPATSGSAPGLAPAKSGEDKDTSGELSDAWEAAQHILQAINFGLQGATSTTEQTTSSAASTGTEAAADASGASGPSGSAHPPPVVAHAGFDFSASVGAGAAGSIGAGVQRTTTLTDEERASLQAQLALLAAQLDELADTEEDDAEDSTVGDSPVQAQTSNVSVSPAADLRKDKGVPMDVNQFPEQYLDGDGHHLTAVFGKEDDAGATSEDSDSDEDMEIVEVPSFTGSDALRT